MGGCRSGQYLTDSKKGLAKLKYIRFINNIQKWPGKGLPSNIPDVVALSAGGVWGEQTTDSDQGHVVSLNSVSYCCCPDRIWPDVWRNCGLEPVGHFLCSYLCSFFIFCRGMCVKIALFFKNSFVTAERAWGTEAGRHNFSINPQFPDQAMREGVFLKLGLALQI